MDLWLKALEHGAERRTASNRVFRTGQRCTLTGKDGKLVVPGLR
jgi:hypothetical protein